MLSFQVFCSAQFSFSFRSLPVHIKEVLLWTCTRQKESYVQSVSSISRKATKRKFSSLIASVDVAAAALDLLQTHQVWEVMPWSLPSNHYIEKDGHIREYFVALFHNKKWPVKLVNEGKLIKAVLDNTSRSGQTMFQGLTILTAF